MVEKNIVTDDVKENSSLLIDIFRQSPFAIELYDQDGRLTEVNQACVDLFGLSGSSELKGFDLFSHPNLTKEIIQKLRAKQSVRCEFVHDFELIKSKKLYNTNKTGIFHLECYINPTINNKDELTGYIVHIIEINDRKHYEQKINDSKELLSSFMEHSPIYTYIKEVTPTQSLVLMASENYQDMIGIHGSEMIGKTMDEIFPPEFAAKITADDWAVVSEDKVLKIEEELNYRKYSTIKFPIQQGNKQYLAGYTIDITEQKKSGEALIKSEEKFRKIIETSTRGMYFYELDKEDRLILTGANPATDKIIGIYHQELIGKTIEEAFPNLANTDIPALYRSIAKGDVGPTQFDIEYKDKNISGYYNVHVFQTEDNLVTVNFTDITARKKTELLLAEQSKELTEINAMKDKIMSIIAHDLKSPFNAIMGFSELMLRNFDQMNNNTIIEGITIMGSAANQAYKMLDNLLIWAQNQSGRIQFSPEKLNLRSQVNYSIKTIESVAKNKDIKIVVKISKDHLIIGDKNMVDTILRNLISNSIKFSPRGSSIKVIASRHDHEVHISISDRGVGINTERISDLFEINKKGSTLGTENEQGTGLGLILCKEFINRHQGRIWVESSPGKGSIFSFSIPVNNSIN
jgi:PAS domain S-box-containing protein